MVVMKVSSVSDDVMAPRKAFSPTLHNNFSLCTRTTYGTVSRHRRSIGARLPRAVTMRITSATTGRAGDAGMLPSGGASVLGGHIVLTSVTTCPVVAGCVSMAALSARAWHGYGVRSVTARKASVSTPGAARQPRGSRQVVLKTVDGRCAGGGGARTAVRRQLQACEGLDGSEASRHRT